MQVKILYFCIKVDKSISCSFFSKIIMFSKMLGQILQRLTQVNEKNIIILLKNKLLKKNFLICLAITKYRYPDMAPTLLSYELYIHQTVVDCTNRQKTRESSGVTCHGRPTLLYGFVTH